MDGGWLTKSVVAVIVGVDGKAAFGARVRLRSAFRLAHHEKPQ